MANVWIASDGGNVWCAREGGAVPAVADAVQMAPLDVRTLIMDFGNLPEFVRGGGINLTVAPVVAITPGGSGITVSAIRQLPVVVTDAEPMGLLLAITQTEDEVFLGAYFVQAVFAASATTGTFTVTVTVQLMDGSILSRAGSLIVG